MLGNEVLMSRALRWAVDEHNLTIDSLVSIPGPLKTELMELSIEVAEDMKYNSLKYFRPFEHQK